MEKIEVNIQDYFSEGEIKEMVRQQFLGHLNQIIKNDAERLLGNFAHFQAQKIVDEVLTDAQKQTIRETTEKILANMGPGTVFHKSWYHREPDSRGQQIINETVRDNRDLIVAKTVEVITNYDFKAKLDDDGLGILREAILEKLSHKCEC